MVRWSVLCPVFILEISASDEGEHFSRASLWLHTQLDHHHQVIEIEINLIDEFRKCFNIIEWATTK